MWKNCIKSLFLKNFCATLGVIKGKSKQEPDEAVEYPALDAPEQGLFSLKNLTGKVPGTDDPVMISNTAGETDQF